MAINISLGRKDKIYFIENLSTLLNSGVPVMKSLQIILFQAKKWNIRSLSEFLATSISDGEPLYIIASRLPKVFSVFDVAILEMGDATGQIGKSLEIIYEKEEKEAELGRKIRQALIYPAAIVCVAVAMITIIMTFVIPKIEGMYREANVSLPRITQVLINTSRFMRENLFYGIILLGIIITTGLFALRDRRVKKLFDEKILWIFIFGNIMRKKVLIVFWEFLSTLLGSGILINKGLLIVRNAVDNAYYEDEIDAVIEEIKAGRTLSSAMWSDLIERKSSDLSIPENKEALKIAERRNKFFPIELSTAVKIWEQTGNLAKMLERVSNRYDKEVDNIIKNISAMLEPAIIIVLGVVVGTIVMAIMLPFFNMMNVVK